jgi:putative tricarboxylic transport membrane protein
VAFRNRDRKDFNAGLMFIGIGAFFAIGAQNYPIGSAVRMGPAYFPTMLGWMLVGLGLIIFLRSFFLHGEPLTKSNLRPLILIIGSVAAFALLLELAGLAVASVVVMIISAMGGWDFRWREQLINAVFLAALNIATFYYGLGLPFKLWPWS